MITTERETCSKLLLVLLSLICVSCLQSQGQNGTQTIDFRGYNANLLNNDGDFVRTTFELPSYRMQSTSEGVRLTFDVGNDPGPFNVTYRSELREQNINTYPASGTSTVYHARFTVEDLPDLYGPVTIFQRFNRDNDGPDIEVELTGANQFSNAVPSDLQVVAFGRRKRLGKFLKPINDLKIIIYSGGNTGKYKVSLNGETLDERDGVNTLGSTQGTWSQFGLYPHGLHNSANRQDQINSGNTKVSFVYHDYTKTTYNYEVNLADFTTEDLNDGNPNPGPGPGPGPLPVDTCSGNPPQNWQFGDIGGPAIQGEVCEDNSTWDIRAAGADIWNTRDEFFYVYRSLDGDIDIEARILSIGDSHFWAKGGVMIREGLGGDARNVFMGITQQGRYTFQRRTIVLDSTRSTRSEEGSVTLPHYVKLEKRGNKFYGYQSADAQNWNLVDSIEIAMQGQLYVGVAATSHDETSLNSTTISEVKTNIPGGGGTACNIPTGWEGQDVGSVAIAGEACANGDQLSISASGSDIWSSEDQFYYVYQPMLGDWQLSARILSIGESDPWAKAGLMIRESLDANAKNAFVASTAGRRWSFQHRDNTADETIGNLNESTEFTFPHWIRLTRRDKDFYGYYSVDGVNWELVGTANIDVPDQILLGIASTAHNNNVLNEVVFDQVEFTTGGGNPGTFPVEFTDFYGIPDPANAKVDLVWNVGMEQGNDYFSVERSIDGVAFESLAQLPSRGDTRRLREYKFSDLRPNSDKNYYRIRQTDIDGQFSYSATIEVGFTSDLSNSIAAYPVPVQSGEQLMVDVNWYSANKSKLEIRDILGRVLYQKNLGKEELQQSISIDTSSLLEGMYYITISDPDGYEKSLAQKIYVNR